VERRYDDAEVTEAGLDTLEFAARLDDLAADAFVPVDLELTGFREFLIDRRHVDIDQRTNPGCGRRIAGDRSEIDGLLRRSRHGGGDCCRNSGRNRKRCNLLY